VISVLDCDSSSLSSSCRNAAIFDLMSSASRLGPANPSSQSSAYAEDRIMPRWLADRLVSGRLTEPGSA
jgi:hypothetical protein